VDISAISVKQLNLYVKSLLDGNPVLNSVCVCGEIANYKCHYASGHSYFALKDDSSTVRAVMFRGAATTLRFVPEDGMKVVCMGRVSLYERDGQYQLYVEYMVPFGEGELAADFEKIKLRLEKDGLLDESRKRKIPKFPKGIAVLTSSSGAAIHDITSVIERRYPLCEILCVPVNVQGATASKDMVNALHKIYTKKGIDVIIIGRGGGSSYDLWAFNDEELARTIANSPIPVISAVGHESDYSICDLVADVRAATPSVAAELAVPDKAEILNYILNTKKYLSQLINQKLDICSIKYENLCNSKLLKYPEKTIVDDRINTLNQELNNLCEKVKIDIENKNNIFSKTVLKLDAISPLKILSRGYSVTEKDGEIVQSINDVDIGDNICVRLNKGKLNCSIISKEE